MIRSVAVHVFVIGIVTLGLFPGSAHATTAMFTLPNGAVLDRATPSQGTCRGTVCQLGTIDQATVSIVVSPSVRGMLQFTASDVETGPKQTKTPVRVIDPTGMVQANTLALQSTPAVPIRACVSHREFKIHIQHAHRLGIVSAAVYVDGRTVQHIMGKRFTATVDLRGRTKRVVTVKILAITRNGKRLTGIRTYHTCIGRLPDHNRLRL